MTTGQQYEPAVERGVRMMAHAGIAITLQEGALQTELADSEAPAKPA